jgi:hypothetical protein
MNRFIRFALSVFLVAMPFTTAVDASAQRGGGGTRGSARTSVNRNSNNNVNRNTNVNSNTNVNRNANVNVNRDVDVNVHGGGYYGGGGCCYHPVAAAAAVGTAAALTAAAIGSMVQTLPPSCAAVAVNGVTYQQCGSTWYQPQFVSGATSYVVVAAPR